MLSYCRAALAMPFLLLTLGAGMLPGRAQFLSETTNLQTVPNPMRRDRQTGGLPNTLMAEKPTFRAPIKRRLGRTPVIEVTFNNSHTFEMIVDTGANDTVITQRMAAAMGIVPVAKLKFDTASTRGIEMPLGRVKLVTVNGATAGNLLVAIAGPELEIGLLGHDFFDNYDITIKRDVIEFNVR